VKLVNDHLAAKAALVPPNGHGYLLLAAEIGGWVGPFPTGGRNRRNLAARLSRLARPISSHRDVEECTVFAASLRAPGEGRDVLAARKLSGARYDVVVLVRTSDVDAAVKLRESDGYRELRDHVTSVARHTHEVVARNAARLGDVDHRPNHAFLFNYFYADDTDTLLQVWEYTAGWFQEKTDLPNSTLMAPIPGEAPDYGIINHASWPGLRTFLPSLIFRPTFRRFVLANFKANNVAAQAIIYRRVE
jgi:hypothetical protein